TNDGVSTTAARDGQQNAGNSARVDLRRAGIVGGATENVTLNAQVDTVKVANVGYLSATDSIDGGAGSDTLTLNYGATSSTTVAFNTANMTGVKGFETINLDGVTGVGTGAITATITDAFAVANQDVSTNHRRYRHDEDRRERCYQRFVVHLGRQWC
ncbi:MAG: hypothetical protein EB072_11750, partial [Betaproteobacteria bacterium]|nr:hypothetical protein [Betaproteobacteria bacterium]